MLNRRFDMQQIAFQNARSSALASFSAVMNSRLIEEAIKVVPVPQVLINVVSQRVRQLGHGQRPMVETTPGMSFSDIALKEVIERKLNYREGSSDHIGAN